MTQPYSQISFFNLIFVLVFLINHGETLGQMGPKESISNMHCHMCSHDQQDISMVPEDIPDEKMILIKSSLSLPFSAEKAFDAYSDLPRQPTWSPWLHKVEYLNKTTGESKWTMKFFGFKFSWTAINLVQERPRIIQWKSTSGLANYGTVTFDKQNDGGTKMNLTMKLQAPRIAVKAFSKSKQLSQFIEQRMVGASLLEFRDVIMDAEMEQER